MGTWRVLEAMFSQRTNSLQQRSIMKAHISWLTYHYRPIRPLPQVVIIIILLLNRTGKLNIACTFLYTAHGPKRAIKEVKKKEKKLYCPKSRYCNVTTNQGITIGGSNVKWNPLHYEALSVLIAPQNRQDQNS